MGLRGAHAHTPACMRRPPPPPMRHKLVCPGCSRRFVARRSDAHMSQREAAKALGVHHSTVQADLGGKSAKSGGKPATKTERRAHRAALLAGDACGIIGAWFLSATINLQIIMTAANAVPVERRSVFLERVGAMLKPRGRFSDDDVRQVAALAMASSEFLAADFSGSG